MAMTEVELESRKRAALAKVLPKGANTRYRIERLEDGTIIMTPVVSLTERELALLGSPELVEQIKRGVEMAHAGKAVRHEPGHFSALAAELADQED
jgi:hypothetical protein